jgi:hypothetical protein
MDAEETMTSRAGGKDEREAVVSDLIVAFILGILLRP